MCIVSSQKYGYTSVALTNRLWRVIKCLQGYNTTQRSLNPLLLAVDVFTLVLPPDSVRPGRSLWQGGHYADRTGSGRALWLGIGCRRQAGWKRAVGSIRLILGSYSLKSSSGFRQRSRGRLVRWSRVERSLRRKRGVRLHLLRIISSWRTSRIKISAGKSWIGCWTSLHSRRFAFGDLGTCLEVFEEGAVGAELGPAALAPVD